MPQQVAPSHVSGPRLTKTLIARARILGDIKLILSEVIAAIPDDDGIEPLAVPRTAGQFDDGQGTIPRKVSAPPPPAVPVVLPRQVGPKKYTARIVYSVADHRPNAQLTITAEPIYHFIKDHPGCTSLQIQKSLKLRDGQLSGALHRLTVNGWIRTSPAIKK